MVQRDTARAFLREEFEESLKLLETLRCGWNVNVI